MRAPYDYTIAVENSTWNNIGDAFYQTSLCHSLREVFPEANVVEFDGPLERSFHADRSALPVKQWYDPRSVVAADLYVFSGPILERAFLPHYRTLIEEIVARGSSYAILSAFAKLKDGSIHENLDFFSRLPPVAFSSRDDDTFEAYRGISHNAFRGICSAFFVSSIPGIPSYAHSPRTIISSFYTRPEPVFFYDGERDSPNIEALTFKAPEWPLWRVSRHLQVLTNRQSTVGPWKIIRPVQDLGYKFPHLNFAAPNRYLSYNLKPYLALFKEAEMTVSDRVHACVASLSFGRPARLIGSFDRASLLRAHSVVHNKNGLLTLDRERVNELRDEFHAFLKSSLSPASVTGTTSSV